MTDEPTSHPAALPDDELKKQVVVKRTRRGGPGGQHRNKVETAVVVTHTATGVTSQASERRSQKDNLRVAMLRLRINLALAIRTKRDAGKTPSSLWQSRSSGQRINVSTEHVDFPTILAEALDVIHENDFAIPEAATRLHVTSSQLLGVVRSEPAAWAWLNQHRMQAGLNPLK